MGFIFGYPLAEPDRFHPFHRVGMAGAEQGDGGAALAAGGSVNPSALQMCRQIAAKVSAPSMVVCH